MTIFQDHVRLDVQTLTPGVDFEESWSRRQKVSHEGIHVNLLSRDDLIASKKAAGRTIYLEDVRLLEQGPGG